MKRPVYNVDSAHLLHRCPILTSVAVLLLSEGQTGRAWEPYKKTLLFRKSEVIGQKSASTPFSSLTTTVPLR